MTKVLNQAGQEIDFDAAAVLMDDEIREMLNAAGIDSEQLFLQTYADKHFAKFGEDFAPWSGAAW